MTTSFCAKSAGKSAGQRLRLSAGALLLLCLGTLMSLTGARAQEVAPRGAPEAVIMGLEEAWNRGDMSAYLDLYQKDESLSLTFGNTVVQGWTALDALFRKSYPDPVRMGRFSIDRIDVLLVGDDAAVAYGNFTHVFPTETIKGGFSHVLSLTQDGSWVIRHERTSRGEVIETH